MSCRVLALVISCLLVERMAAIGVRVRRVCVVHVEEGGVEVRSKSEISYDLRQAVWSICIHTQVEITRTRICCSRLPCS